MSSIGSGLDVPGIVDSLMAAQQRDLDQLNYEKTFYQNQQSAYTKFQGSLTQFNSTLTSLSSVFENHLYKIQSSNESIASAVTSSQAAAPGNYTIDVQQLAQSQQISSGAFASKNQAIGQGGDLTIDIGTKSLTLEVAQTDTLETIRDHINNSLNNPGVNASILKSIDSDGNDQYQLLLTSTDSGLANTMTISGDMQATLDISHELAAAQNAKFTINGFNEESSSNLISDALDGVVIHLNGQTGSTNLSISADTENEEAAITSALQAMIDSYNGLIDLLSKNQSLSSLRDNTYSLIQMNLQHGMQQVIGNSSVSSLSDLGVKLDAPQKVTNDEGVEYVVGGKLTIDKDQLNNMLMNNMSDVETFFTNPSSGFITNMESDVSDISTGTISNRVKIINQETNSTNQRIGREEVRLDDMRANLTKQYAALDVYLARYASMSDFLTQQLDSISAFSNNKK